jgi:hypothetical protein
VVNFAGGTKGLTLINVIYVALIYWYVRGRLPLRWFVLGACVWMLVTPWNLAYRERINAGQVDSGDGWTIVGALTGSLQDAFLRVDPGTAWTHFLENTEARVPLLQEAALVVEYAERNGIAADPMQYLLLPVYALVPRIVWPDKPVFNSGNWVDEEIYGVRNSHSSTAITGVGDFFLGYGAAGVFLGFLVWGMLFRVLEDRAGQSGVGILLIGVLYQNLINVPGNDALGIMGGMVKDLIVFAAFLRLTGFVALRRRLAAPARFQSSPSPTP